MTGMPRNTCHRPPPPMPWLTRPAAALAWIGRQGTRAVALSVFVGLALPPLAALMKPAFTASLFVLLCLAFLRVDPGALRAHLARPRLVIAAAAWIDRKSTRLTPVT